jgi:hypothetical protein
VLFPDLKICPKKTIQIRDDLNTRPYSNSSKPEACAQMARMLALQPFGRDFIHADYSLSLSETYEILFESKYLINLHDEIPGKDRWTIMLCPHVNADRLLRNVIGPRDLICRTCHITPSVKSSDDKKRYDIEFTRSFGEVPLRTYAPGEHFSDFNWLRYVLSCPNQKDIVLCIWLSTSKSVLTSDRNGGPKRSY